jgi:hypothetical protein
MLKLSHFKAWKILIFVIVIKGKMRRIMIMTTILIKASINERLISML